ncbi:MAG: extracellular solute-binding protein [Chloroflexota bacterium]
MKKKFSLITILVIVSLMLGACAKATPTVAPTEPPVVETEPVVVETEPVVEETLATVTVWVDDTRSTILAELAEEFKAAYGVELVVEEVASLRDQFIIAAPAGEGPDITIIPHDQAGQMIASGLLAPIDLGDKAADFVPISLTAFTFDGQLYGMPYATENLGFFYNTELVPVPPTTWQEVHDMGKALMDEGNATYGFTLSGTTYDAFPLMTAKGGYIFGLDENGNWNPKDVGVGGEGMIAAGTLMKEWVDEGFISNNTDWDTAHTLFETSEVPFIMAGPWALDRIRLSGVPYAITNFPDGGQPFLGVQGFVVNAMSENQLLAQAFLTEFVATDEVMQKLYEVGQRASAFTPVLDATDDADLAAMGAAGAEASLMPAIPEMGSVWSAWGDAISLILQGELTPAEALANAQAQIEGLIAGALAGMVNVPGSYQVAVGCPGDWQPDCEATALVLGADGLYTATHALPAGDYEFKVALDGSWAVNYGVDGALDGDNYPLSLAADSNVTFSYDPETHILTITVE